MTNKGLMTAALIAIAAAGGVALAGQDSRMGKWSKADKDGDGKVAVSEIDQRHRDFIAKADADRDGFITEDEMEAMHEAKKAEMKAKMFPDANKDGAVDRREFEDAARARFAEIDANSDGRITEDEMRAHHPRRRFFGHGADGDRD